MKRLVLMVMMLAPVAAMAQKQDLSLKRNDAGTGLAGSILTREFNLIPARSSVLPNMALPMSPEPAAQKAKRESAQRSNETERPRTEGSMVGYIDDAIVGSQIRIRFDAAFNDPNPDLAEFFYAKCGCYRNLPSSSPAYDPNSPGPPSGTNLVIPRTINFQQVYFHAEFAPTSRYSFFFEAPFRWIQGSGLVVGSPGSFPNESGLSDLQAGLKFALLEQPGRALTAQFRAYFPTGDALRGLGTNHYSLEPAVLYYQRLSRRAAVESEFNWWHPIGGSAGVPTSGSKKFAGNVITYGVGPSYKAYNGESVTVTPVVEFVGWHILSGFWTGHGDASGTNIANLKLGARFGFRGNQSVYLGYGHVVTSSGAQWYQDLFRAEYRRAF